MSFEYFVELTVIFWLGKGYFDVNTLVFIV